MVLCVRCKQADALEIRTELLHLLDLRQVKDSSGASTTGLQVGRGFCEPGHTLWKRT